MMKELVSMMVENSKMIDWEVTFGGYKYIIVVSEEKVDEINLDWEGKIKSLRRMMDKNSDQQNTLLREVESKSRANTKRAIQDRGG
jgi:hypothetical protein